MTAAASWLEDPRRVLASRVRSNPKKALDDVRPLAAWIKFERQLSEGQHKFLNWHVEDIRQAYEHFSPQEAVERIERLWQQIDVADGVAEAKMRLLLRRLTPPELRDVRPSLEVQLKQLVGGSAEDSVHPDVIDSVRSLLRALPPSVDPTLEADGRGAVEVDFGGASQLTWLVERPRITWPGVSVRAYARAKGSRGPVKVKPFHQAFGLLEHAKQHLE